MDYLIIYWTTQGFAHRMCKSIEETQSFILATEFDAVYVRVLGEPARRIR